MSSAATSQFPPTSERRSSRREADVRRILFVDDDDLILRSIERVLKRHAQESSWELHFVTDGETALDRLAQQPFDVILVDAHMPRMSGTMLLRRVQELHPGMVRILLSGHTGLDVLRTSLPLAHQFIAKPCDAQLLKTTLDNACGIRGILNRPELRQMVGGSNELPSAPRTYVEITNALSNPHASSRTVADIVERDIAISARVIQLVSSGFYGLPRQVGSIGGAVAFLGVEVIKAIVLSIEVSKMFPVSQAIPDFSIDSLQKRSLAAAQLAKRLLGHESGGDNVLIAGMLQDVGQLIFAARAPQRFSIALSTSTRGKSPLYEAELELFGSTHAEVGGYLLGLWGLPTKIVQAVARHLEPLAGSRIFDAAGAMYVSNLLSVNPDVPALEEVPARAIALDLSYLRTLGVAHQLEDWRRIARDMAGGGSAPTRLAARA
ncbi:MAG TPA: HDOD domain-containing protein [Polyangiaceae bacterium]|jgi:HD-like signal output (HDOD) protein|nr:HDOD domain-containing protein [Polyangiaceae bacterium]